MIQRLNDILHSLMNGDLSCLNSDNIIFVSDAAVKILNTPVLDDTLVAVMEQIITISQIVYNNTDRDVLFLDDGVYDLLLEKDKEYNKNFQVGGPVVDFKQKGEFIESQPKVEPIIFMEDADNFIANSLYYNDLNHHPPANIPLDTTIYPEDPAKTFIKKNVNIPHMYPKLVGSLDKCKFTLNKEAIDRGVFNDPNVKIFERDFLGKHLQMGLIDMNTPFELVAELKYDGVSVEADVTNEILSARSRGDANADMAADMSYIFKGYRFPFAPEIPREEAFGMKFEAIMTYDNLEKMAHYRDRSYKNSRNGVVGLLGSSDGYRFRNLVTLVPLATSIEDIDRVDEIEFLNKYYNSGEYLRYAILRGTYTQILYQVYKFVKEAEHIRPIMPFMYDGVVISYRDKNIIKALGRENSINKYSMAIKFNPLKREAIFTGYTYTVGQDGTVTPMIHYTPVEFYGTIHSKSSGHSYKRFKELNLAIGDVLNIEYVNDVMPYVYKSQDNTIGNNRQPEEFPTVCPFCGATLAFRDSGRSVYCPNLNCPERNVARIANMMDKLNLKDFGENTFRFLGTKSFSELMNYKFEDLAPLGNINAQKLLDRINEIKTVPVYDYNLIGSIGFTGIAKETWKKILNVVSLDEIISLSNEDLYCKLQSIKGIGHATIETILNERISLAPDLNLIASMNNVIKSTGMSNNQKTIRFTGCRPSDDLFAYLTSKGCDARGDAGVTKNTDVLVVPYIGFTSSKVSKVGPNTKIVDWSAFNVDPDAYL